jgi:predicted MPP superfamily phosphohydrolase
MFPPLPAVPTVQLFLVVLAVALVSLRRLLPQWWRLAAVRWGAALASLAIGAGFVMWVGGPEIGSYAVSYWGVVVAWGLLTLLAPVALSLPIAGVAWQAGLRLLGGRSRRRFGGASRSPPPQALRECLPNRDLPRRDVLKAAVATIPAAALSTSGTGLLAANAPPRVPIVKMAFRDLPRDLEGLRILQLSDLHLGACLGVADLEWFLARVEKERPDLVLFTGDVADDVSQIQPALRLATQLRPRLGVFASMGNHEYLHDGRVTRPLFEKSPVPLLVDRGLALRVGRSTLWLAGADEPPGHPGAFEAPGARFDDSIRACLDGAPSDAFRLLMCHRPEGFPAAAREGFHLTLSGHTHGGQVGLLGKSLLESREHPYVWGAYALGVCSHAGSRAHRSLRSSSGSEMLAAGPPLDRPGHQASRLYTTSGFGHWFPFRLGCPAEAPVVLLTSGQ